MNDHSEPASHLLHKVPGQSAVLNEDRTVLAMRSCKTESQLLIVPQRHLRVTQFGGHEQFVRPIRAAPRSLTTIVPNCG